jgi:signal transduction histidine kinase
MKNIIKKYFCLLRHILSGLVCIVRMVFFLQFVFNFFFQKSAYSQNNTDKTKEETYLDSMLYVSQKIIYSINPIKGKEMIEEIKIYSKEHALNKVYAKALIFESRYYTLIGDLKTAIDLLYEAEQILLKLNEKKTLGDCYKAMSITYSKMTDPRRERNVELSIKAINMYQVANFQQGVISVRANLSNEYISTDRLDSANYHLTLIKKNIGNKPYFYYNFNKGKLFLKQKKYYDALKEFQEATQHAKEVDSEITGLTYIGKCYTLTGQLDMALENLNKAIRLAQNYRIPPDEMEAQKEIINVYLLFNNYQKAFQHQTRLNKIKDSLENINKQNVIAEIEAKLRLSEKDRTIQKQNLKIKTTQIEKEKNKIYVLFLTGIVSILAISIFLLILYNRKSKKSLRIITRQKKELEQQKETLERLNTVNQKIFSVISHDFSAPLITLYNLTDLLQKDTLSRDDIHFYASDIKNQLGQSQQTLNNLLTWAKTELNPLSNAFEKCNLHNIFEEVTHEFSHAVAKKELSVKNDIDPHFEIEHNPNIIKIVFRNLLSNAVKFSFQKGIIQAENDHKTFILRDNGTGIETTSLKQLFTSITPSKLGTNNESGFGLGLFVISEIVSKFGGKICAEHNSPRGAVFKVQFHER